jgi:hypothetical protein
MVASSDLGVLSVAGKCRWASAHLCLPTEMKPFRLTDSTFDHVGGSILGGQNFCLQTYP